MTKLEALRSQFKNALARLEEILQEKKSAIVRDSAIKRFEFTFDLAWKLLKSLLEEEKGVTCASPKECFRAAFQNGFIAYDEYWLQMTDWRNSAVHWYSEKFVEDLFQRLPEVLKRFQQLERL